MNHIPRLDSIEERLRHALRQIAAFPGLGEQIIGASLSSGQIERTVRDMLQNKNEWFAAVPASLDVQEWVEVHWDTERQTQPPAGTVSDGDKWGNQGEVQLDALTATFKLLLAATRHGAETVAKCAVEFAAHGMIEVRSLYLLKGAVPSAEPLDRYCTLLPYQDALQKMNVDYSADTSARHLTEQLRYWPPETADNVCVLETLGFERRSVAADEFKRHVSSLLQCGIETLAHILGLVWGTGFRVFGGYHSVAEPVAATLPFFHAASGRSMGIGQTLLTLPGFRRPSTNRPLNNVELVDLIGKYAALSEQTQRVLNLAMRRLRDSTERIELEDKVIDVSISLEVLFMEGEQWDQKALVSRRGSWHFADSHPERDQTRTLLKEFYDYRSNVVHGNTPGDLTPEERERRVTQLAAIENIVRASLKTMVSEGRPQDWEKSKNFKAIRRDPPRAATEIPSMKSDSLSWTVAEQNEIDKALEAVWKPEVDNAPLPRPDASSVSHQGINAEEIERCRQQGIPYVISVPIRLYMAHPKWPKQESDPVDERTKYYCEKDVDRHLRRWQKAASEKKMYQFELPLEDPSMYLPESFDMWRKILRQGEQP